MKKKYSKRYKKLSESNKDKKIEMIDDAIKKIKSNCNSKFDESIDLNFQINNKQKKSEINIRTVVNLPGGTGKKVKIAVVCEDTKFQEAKDAGAEVVGGDDLIEKIKAGDLNFEKLICTSGMMIKLSKLGKVLGPKGLMPNPKSGTVTTDILNSVKEIKAGKIELRVEKNGIVHVQCGKSSFDETALEENIKTVYETIMKAKPSSVKGTYFKKMTISSSMGPGIKIDHGNI